MTRRAPRTSAKASSTKPKRARALVAAPRSADSEAERHVRSGTAIAADALRTGLAPAAVRRRIPIPRVDETMLVGDPDVDSLANEYVGEDTPGGSTPTPDQNNVDDIGRAYGLQDEDTGALRSGGEVLERRDRHRPELRAPRKPPT
jgi:Family of unknown function (DUF6335)